jgi:hypothetical protein
MRGEGSSKLDDDQTKTGAHESLPRFIPRRVKTYVLLFLTLY